MRTSTTATAVLGSLALVGALAACSTPAATTGTGSGSGTSTDAGTDAGTSTGTTTGTYKDGTYTESASYSAPSGTETVDVTLTLADNIVTAVEVAGHATDPQAKEHQGEFKDGIAAVVVGKNIDDLKVDKVGGSSLTSAGFTKAVDLIKADAAA